MNFVLEKSIDIKYFLEKTKAFTFFSKKNIDYKIEKIITDTRSYKDKGGLFFAIKGKFFDGHKFIKDIIEKIDFVILSDKSYIIDEYKRKFIVVKDTVLALDNLALIYKNLFDRLKIVVVVGSNGKTTTKELIKSIFSKKYKTLASFGNFNNQIGVAYTLLSLTKEIEYCILECGISIPKEMDVLGFITSPDVVVFTNIGKEHLEFFGSLNKVFYEETRILNYLKHDGLVIINKDDKFLSNLKIKNKKTYSVYDKTADVYLEKFKFFETHSEMLVCIKNEKFFLKSNLLGLYNIYNILAALTTAWFNGITKKEIIKKAIFYFKAVSMRGERFIINNNIIVDESYNANPDSMSSAIIEFTNIFKKREKILVLGDMLELGKKSNFEHKNLSKFIDLNSTYKIFLLGKKIKFLYKEIYKLDKNKVKFYKDNKELLYKDLKNLILKNKNLAILFKASNNIGLFEIVKKLSQNLYKLTKI